MKTAAAIALIAILSSLTAAHTVAGEVAPEEIAASWLSRVSPFITELMSNMSPPHVSVVGEEDFTPSGEGITYNVTWYGRDAYLTTLITLVGTHPVRLIAVLRVNGSAPWFPYPAMIDAFEEVVSHYKDVLGGYPSETGSGIESYNRYWSARYIEVGGHRLYVGIGKPAQVLVRLRDDDGVIELLIADQLGPLRDAGTPLTEGGFMISESVVRERFCGDVCMVEDVWLLMNGSLRPAYVVRSFSGGEGSVRVVDASAGAIIYEDSWPNQELVRASPKPPSMREIIGNIAEVIAAAPAIIAVAAVLVWRRRHPGERLPQWAGPLVVAALLIGLLLFAVLMAGLGGFWSSICAGSPGGLYIEGVEDLDGTGKVVHLGFSSGPKGFTVLKLVAWRGRWVSECVRCVFMVPPNSVGNTTVVFDGVPEAIGGEMRVGVYGYPDYITHPYIYLGWRRYG